MGRRLVTTAKMVTTATNGVAYLKPFETENQSWSINNVQPAIHIHGAIAQVIL